jgi:hypothetical protein
MSLSLQQKELIQRSFLNAFDQEEQKQLNELLRSSKEARDHYRQAASLDSILRDHSDTHSIEAMPESKNQFLLWKMAALFFMCLSLVLAAVTLRPDFSPMDAIQSTHDNLAIVQHAVNLNKNDASIISEGKSLKEGLFEIEKGMVQLDFISGVSLIAEGPLKLDLKNDMEVHCFEGKVRVLVPPQATGFKLHTPDTQVLDLGTEFGVVVSDGGSDISVIDGKVELYENNQKEAELLEGDVMNVQGDQYVKTNKANYVPSPIDLALALEQRALAKNQFWLDSIASLQKDTQLTIYYDFRKKDPWGKILHNLMAPSKSLSYGAIIGADWIDGRLGPETALEFKGHHNFIRLQDNRNYDSMSLLTWVRIDSLDVHLTSLLHSDNWSNKAVHWHISNTGVLTFGIKSKYGEDTIIRSPEKIINEHHFGKWLMIVSTYDGPNGIARQYLNGQLVDERTDLKTAPGQIGKAQIGGWMAHGKQTGRALNGRMDRFAVWSKALRHEEILQLYLQGNPISPLALNP